MRLTAPSIFRVPKHISLLALSVIATFTFFVGVAFGGLIAKAAWKNMSDGWQEVAMGYKDVSKNCIALPPGGAVQPLNVIPENSDRQGRPLVSAEVEPN